MKENGFKLANERSKCYHAQTITDADYADDISLIENTGWKRTTTENEKYNKAVGVCFLYLPVWHFISLSKSN